MPYRVLFVCLGNICRSPLAEAAMRREVTAAGLDIVVDSAGTGDWHIGQPPDVRAQAVARKNGVNIGAFRARQVTARDFDHFSHVVALDAQNLSDLAALRPDGSTVSLSLLLDHVAGREGQGVADPYHGGMDDFDIAWADVAAGTAGLLKALMSRQI
jgi:protein-tyrosine phosphatase